MTDARKMPKIALAEALARYPKTMRCLQEAEAVHPVIQTLNAERFARLIASCENPHPPSEALIKLLRRGRAPTTGE